MPYTTSVRATAVSLSFLLFLLSLSLLPEHINAKNSFHVPKITQMTANTYYDSYVIGGGYALFSFEVPFGTTQFTIHPKNCEQLEGIYLRYNDIATSERYDEQVLTYSAKTKTFPRFGNYSLAVKGNSESLVDNVSKTEFSLAVSFDEVCEPGFAKAFSVYTPNCSIPITVMNDQSVAVNQSIVYPNEEEPDKRLRYYCADIPTLTSAALLNVTITNLTDIESISYVYFSVCYRYNGFKGKCDKVLADARSEIRFKVPTFARHPDRLPISFPVYVPNPEPGFGFFAVYTDAKRSLFEFETRLSIIPDCIEYDAAGRIISHHTGPQFTVVPDDLGNNIYTMIKPCISELLPIEMKETESGASGSVTGYFPPFINSTNLKRDFVYAGPIKIPRGVNEFTAATSLGHAMVFLRNRAVPLLNAYLDMGYLDSTIRNPPNSDAGLYVGLVDMEINDSFTIDVSYGDDLFKSCIPPASDSKQSCNGRGECDNVNDICLCDYPYSGQYCEFTPTPVPGEWPFPIRNDSVHPEASAITRVLDLALPLRSLADGNRALRCLLSATSCKECTMSQDCVWLVDATIELSTEAQSTRSDPPLIAGVQYRARQSSFCWAGPLMSFSGEQNVTANEFGKEPLLLRYFNASATLTVSEVTLDSQFWAQCSISLPFLAIGSIGGILVIFVVIVGFAVLVITVFKRQQRTAGSINSRAYTAL